MSGAGGALVSGLAGWAIDALIASALLMAAVLLVRGPVRRAFGAQIAYALWALPALRLLLPPLPAGWWQAQAAAPITRAGETIAVYVIDPVAAPGGPTLGLVLAIVWALGAAAVFGWHLLRHARFCRAAVRAGETIEERDGIRVIASAAVQGPLAFGLWRRYVAFPRDFAERYDPTERALALQHELGHHARRDLHANWIALVVLVLHWWNPLAWRAFYAFRADQELANDARVLAGCDRAAAHAYGRALVKAAAGPKLAPQSAGACQLQTIADLKGRLRMLTTSRASRRRIAAGSAAVTLLVAGGLGLTASSSAAEKIQQTLATPVAPPAPEPADAGPDAPPAPPGPTGPGSGGRHVQTRRDGRAVQVTVSQNGRTRHYEGAEADAYLAANPDLAPVPPVPSLPPLAGARGERHRIVIRNRDGDDMVVNVPDVRNQNCPGAGRPTIHEQHGDRQRIIICTDRIERLSREGAAMAANSADIERRAMTHAREGLQRAREAITRDRNLSDEQRREALSGLDEALAELESDHRN